MIERVRIFTLLVAGSALASCGGDPSPTGPDPGGDGSRMTLSIIPNPSFEHDVQEIFVRNGCTGSSCHGAGQGGFFLLPNSATNYTNIVNVRADAEREFLLVEPFDATNSYVVIRLEGRQSKGSQMPGTSFDSIDLANLRNWIDNGAPNN